MKLRLACLLLASLCTFSLGCTAEVEEVDFESQPAGPSAGAGSGNVKEGMEAQVPEGGAVTIQQ